MIIFISGGARSGKSTYAEKMARSIYSNAKNARLIYIATAKRSDKEMERRIKIHRQEREDEWQVEEESYELSRILENLQSGDVILIDCLTIWLSNMMFDRTYSYSELVDEVSKWCSIAKEKQLQLIIVSNDLNEGCPSRFELVNEYMYNLERLHQLVVQEAQYAIQTIAGIPTYWKGEKNEE
ncbi:bifunctional adenosylcobinamide kinase/adenosylcobinamide-phosphate guanylyltransferase [Sutcliffiella sp. NPDC057660]|uniref:bifunctional adenosylcobinamide kinase/adenosylcobinamide-phosphate guanylyltransferase n=1 Tax=Sutcliffiella sp. NPDC057660 TaxID=3346199 RepID=UPI00368E945E